MNTILTSRRLAFFLLIVSLALYGIDYFFFGGGEVIAAGFLGNLAFLPVYVLFVTLIIEKVLKERERHAIKQKLNMVIGVFFSEVGTAMLRDCLGFVRNADELAKSLGISLLWTPDDFKKATGHLARHRIEVDSRKGDIVCLKRFLVELEARHSFAGLSAADLDHLSGDIKRAYSCLLREWLAYIQHLKEDYPYLFSLAVRTNPLNPEARAEIS